MFGVVPARQLFASLFCFFFYSLFLWLRVLVCEASAIVLHYSFGMFHVEVELTEMVLHHQLLSHLKKISNWFFFPLQLQLRQFFIVFWWCFDILGCCDVKLSTALARWRYSSLRSCSLVQRFKKKKKKTLLFSHMLWVWPFASEVLFKPWCFDFIFLFNAKPRK